MINLVLHAAVAVAPAYEMSTPGRWIDVPAAAVPRLWATIPIAIGLGLLAAVWVSRRRHAAQRHLPLVHSLVGGTGLSGRDVRLLDRLAAGGGVPTAASVMISAGTFDACRAQAQAAGVALPDAALESLRRRLYGRQAGGRESGAREAGRTGEEKKSARPGT